MLAPEVMTTDAAGVREGEVVARKYRVERVLGVGGMGVVVAAHHIELDQRVAIKFLLPEVLGHGEAVARFAREARAAVKIKSEHVAKVTDVGKLDNGAPYMVMEFLDGGDLASWLRTRGALPVEQAVEFVLQACEAIAEAHALGIVHRDLKPGNLFVIRRPDGALSVKVLDFGISKDTGMTGSSGAAAMTKTSALMGSPLYMSPEQMQSSRDVDARSDIWALGVILYELVTGSPPFTADTMPELVLRVVQGDLPVPVRVRRPDATPGLDEVLLQCLQRDRAKRFESIGVLAAALLPFAPKRSRASVERISGVLRSAGLSASALGLPPSSDNEGQTAPSGTSASWGTTARPTGRRRWLTVGGCAVIVVASAAALLAQRESVRASVAASAAPGEPVVALPPIVPPAVPPPIAPTAPEAPAAPSPPTAAPVVPGSGAPSSSVHSSEPGKLANAKPTSAGVIHKMPTLATATARATSAVPPPEPPRPDQPKRSIFDDRN
jgi:serine/threonine protein kinase